MAKNFEWRKDEEDGWEEPKPQPERPSRPFRPHPLYFVIIILVGVVGWLGYRQVQKRVEGTAVSLEQQVQASAILLQQAVIEGDDELFNSLLDETMKSLVRDEWLTLDQYWQRETFGWQWQSTAVTTPTVTLSPDLQMAVAMIPQTYAVQMPNGVTETMVLSQTAVFRSEQGNWLLTIPDDDFWGEEQTIEGDSVTLLFPARDRKIARQLVTKLDAIIPIACIHVTGYACSNDDEERVSWQFRLDRSYAYFSLHVSPILLSPKTFFFYPAPTLTGLPTTERGLEIVTTAYATNIVRRHIVRPTGRTEEPTFFSLILAERVLVEMGLQPLWLLPHHYNNVLNDAATLQEISSLWEPGSDVDTFLGDSSFSQIATLIEFLLARGETLVSLDTRLATANNFWEWANIDPNDPTVEREWLQFLYNHSSYAAQSAPIPLPTSDIRLLCADDLLRYDLAAHTWRSERPFNRTLIEIVPEEGGLIVAGRLFDEAMQVYREEVLWWQNGREKLLTNWRTNPDLLLQSAQRHDPSGRKLVLMMREPFAPIAYFLLDLDACGAAACSLSSLLGLPVWSPDGRYTLITPFNDSQPGQLWLGDSNAHPLTELEMGYAPFWLDDENYGYVRIGNIGYSQVVIANSATNEPRLIATVEGLLGQIPGPDNLLTMAITAVQPHPTNPHNLFATILSGEPAEMSIFELKLVDDGSVQTTRILNNWADAVMTFSADGRNQIVDKTNAATNQRTITVSPTADRGRDLFTFMADATTTYDWTADGQWLLLNTPNHLKLIAPDYDYQQFIFHDFSGCYEAQWVK